MLARLVEPLLKFHASCTSSQERFQTSDNASTGLRRTLPHWYNLRIHHSTHSNLSNLPQPPDRRPSRSSRRCPVPPHQYRHGFPKSNFQNRIALNGRVDVRDDVCSTSDSLLAGLAAPDSNGGALDGDLSAECACVLGVLTDFHLLHLLPEGSTISIDSVSDPMRENYIQKSAGSFVRSVLLVWFWWWVSHT